MSKSIRLRLDEALRRLVDAADAARPDLEGDAGRDLYDAIEHARALLKIIGTTPRVLGWSRAQNRIGDETGVWHLVLDEDGRAKTACGTRGRISGQVERLDGHPCAKCAQIARRLGVAP